MLFSSITFLYFFLPCVMVIYLVVPKGLKNIVLLLSSLIFYAWGEPRYLIWMLMMILQGYIFGRFIEICKNRRRSKVFLAASVIFSLGMLGYCKYADFFIENFNHLFGSNKPLLHVVLPIGISFYTFQILSYVIDVYRGDAKAQKNIINLAMYIAMFPQLIAGPIVRYGLIESQLTNRKSTLNDITSGIWRFVLGLAKKVLIANQLGAFVSVYKASDEKSVLFVWAYAIAFTLHIYFDFSGYSDMAIGLGRVFGFHFSENFDYPYISKSIKEFWRRWHQSLGQWFRDYVYIPLGGNRKGKARFVLNILIVWALTGFWHGAAWHFMLWGLLYALLLLVEKWFLGKFLENKKMLGHVYVMFFVTIGFVLFDALDVFDAARTIGSMFGCYDLPLTSGQTLYYLKSYGSIFILAILAATPVFKLLYQKASSQDFWKKILIVLEPVCMVILLLVITAYLVDGSFNPFLYFRF